MRDIDTDEVSFACFDIKDRDGKEAFDRMLEVAGCNNAEDTSELHGAFVHARPAADDAWRFYDEQELQAANRERALSYAASADCACV